MYRIKIKNLKMWVDRSQVNILSNSNYFSDLVIKSIGRIDKKHR